MFLLILIFISLSFPLSFFVHLTCYTTLVETPKAPEKPKEEPKAPEKPKEEPKAPEKPKEEPKAPEKPKEEPKAPEKPKEEPKAPEKPKEQPKAPEKPKEEPKPEAPKIVIDDEGKCWSIEIPTLRSLHTPPSLLSSYMGKVPPSLHVVVRTSVVNNVNIFLVNNVICQQPIRIHQGN